MSDERTWRYHKTEAPVLCANLAEAEALGPEWSDKDIREFPHGADRLNGAVIDFDAPTAPEPPKRGKKKAA